MGAIDGPMSKSNNALSFHKTEHNQVSNNELGSRPTKQDIHSFWKIPSCNLNQQLLTLSFSESHMDDLNPYQLTFTPVSHIHASSQKAFHKLRKDGEPNYTYFGPMSFRAHICSSPMADITVTARSFPSPKPSLICR